MRARGFLALGIVAYAVFLAATVPARFAVRQLALPPGIALSNVEGTVWQGAARADVTASGAEAKVDVRWRFLPASLVSGRLAFAIEARGKGLDAHGTVARSFGGYEARGVELRADAAQLAAVSPLLATWRPQGALTLSAPAFAWDEARARGSARAEWKNASLALTDVRPLGDYRIEASAEGGPAAFTVTTLEGALRIAGHGTFAPPDALAFSGEARAVGNAASALEPLLNLLGPRRADGARTLEWRSIPRSTARSR